MPSASLTEPPISNFGSKWLSCFWKYTSPQRRKMCQRLRHSTEYVPILKTVHKNMLPVGGSHGLTMGTRQAALRWMCMSDCACQKPRSSPYTSYTKATCWCASCWAQASHYFLNDKCLRKICKSQSESTFSKGYSAFFFLNFISLVWLLLKNNIKVP